MKPTGQALEISDDGTRQNLSADSAEEVEKVEEEDDEDAATSTSGDSDDSDSWTTDGEDDKEAKKTPPSEEALAASIPKFTVECDVMPTDVQFSRSEDVLATADMDGRVKIWKLSTDSATLATDLLAHRSPCRAVRFTQSGDNLLSVGKDKRLCVIDARHGTVTQTFKKAHEASIYCVLPIGEHGVVTGDDDGCVKVWDLRSPTAAMEFRDNNEYITAFACDEDEKTLLATSGDGTLSAFNLRRKRLDLQSEAFPSELLSVAVIKGGSKVVCGTGDGGLLVFKWGEWGYTLDQYPGREPMSIDAIEVLSPDRIFTASSDGNIRLINMMPYRMLGYAGYHTLPFERISLSPSKDLIASTSHDSQLRFWNVARFNEIPATTADGSDDSDDSDGDERDDSRAEKGAKRKNNSTRMPKKRSKPAGNDFFSDL